MKTLRVLVSYEGPSGALIVDGVTFAKGQITECDEAVGLRAIQVAGHRAVIVSNAPAPKAKVTVDQPALADGGLVTDPVIAAVGEVGPEAVLPADPPKGKHKADPPAGE